MSISMSETPKYVIWTNLETYLGDVISNNGPNQRNINKRVKSDMGVICQILSILNSITTFYYQITLILKDLC